jgi:hypothetical protein
VQRGQWELLFNALTLVAGKEHREWRALSEGPSLTMRPQTSEPRRAASIWPPWA